MDPYGTYEEIDGRPALRFERRLTHPVERVWRAVTDPGELSHWFPARMDADLHPGGHITFTFPDADMPLTEGEVKEFDPPSLFEFTWGDDRLRIELEPAGQGCLLRFTHFLAERDQAARDASGWHVCLAELDKHLAGEHATGPGTEMTDELRELYAEYEQRGAPTGAPMPS